MKKLKNKEDDGIKRNRFVVMKRVIIDRNRMKITDGEQTKSPDGSYSRGNNRISSTDLSTNTKVRNLMSHHNLIVKQHSSKNMPVS